MTHIYCICDEANPQKARCRDCIGHSCCFQEDGIDISAHRWPSDYAFECQAIINDPEDIGLVITRRGFLKILKMLRKEGER